MTGLLDYLYWIIFNADSDLRKRLTSRSANRENGTKAALWVDYESRSISDPSQGEMPFNHPRPSHGETREDARIQGHGLSGEQKADVYRSRPIGRCRFNMGFRHIP